MTTERQKGTRRTNARVIFALAGIYFTLVMTILLLARFAVGAPFPSP